MPCNRGCVCVGELTIHSPGKSAGTSGSWRGGLHRCRVLPVSALGDGARLWLARGAHTPWGEAVGRGSPTAQIRSEASPAHDSRGNRGVRDTPDDAGTAASRLDPSGSGGRSWGRCDVVSQNSPIAQVKARVIPRPTLRRTRRRSRHSQSALGRTGLRLTRSSLRASVGFSGVRSAVVVGLRRRRGTVGAASGSRWGSGLSATPALCFSRSSLIATATSSIGEYSGAIRSTIPGFSITLL